RHTRFSRDWSSDVCSSDLALFGAYGSMNSSNLYGATLTHELMDVLAQYHESQGNLFLANAQEYNYRYETIESRLASVWGEMYKRSEERRVGKEGRTRRPAE